MAEHMNPCSRTWLAHQVITSDRGHKKKEKKKPKRKRREKKGSILSDWTSALHMRRGVTKKGIKKDQEYRCDRKSAAERHPWLALEKEGTAL